MNKWKNDIAVLLIFFARPDTFQQVFDIVKEAKPRVLLLWQDGPREGNDKDVQGIEECRKIVENIDWECEVHRNYHEKNMGCDPSTFLAHKWAFSIVDKCIVLEDDQKPDLSFFPYCKELLDHYENDERVNHICGYNMLGESRDCPNDYLFWYNGSGAWASWKRVADGWDSTYAFLHNEYNMKNVKARHGKIFDEWYKTAKRHERSGKEFWETILGFDCILNNRLAIIPKINLVSNIGLTAESTHSNAELKLLTKKQRKMFNNPVHSMQFPMKRPKYVVPDYEYFAELTKITGKGRPGLRLMRKIFYFFKCIIYGKWGNIFRAIKRRKSRKII